MGEYTLQAGRRLHARYSAFGPVQRVTRRIDR